MDSAVERFIVNADEDDNDDTSNLQMVETTMMTYKELVHSSVTASDNWKQLNSLCQQNIVFESL